MENGAPQNEGKDPSGFLSQIIGNAVTVKLNSGVVYKGEMKLLLGPLKRPCLLAHTRSHRCQKFTRTCPASCV